MALKQYSAFLAWYRTINADVLNKLFQGQLQFWAIQSAGQISSSGYIGQSVASALTAAGTNRGTALVIKSQVNNITTAAASTGAVLPLGSTLDIGNGHSSPITIFNAGANPITVYASGSDTIDGTAGATGVTLTNAKRCTYYPVSVSAGVTTWISAQLGVVSA